VICSINILCDGDIVIVVEVLTCIGFSFGWFFFGTCRRL